MYVVVANLCSISCSRLMYVLVVEVKTDVCSCFYGNVRSCKFMSAKMILQRT